MSAEMRDCNSRGTQFAHCIVWNVLEQFTTQYQKHYANDADELESYGFFKKSKARVTKHDDQSKQHHHEGANLDQPCDQQNYETALGTDARLHKERIIGVREQHVNPSSEMSQMECVNLFKKFMTAQSLSNSFNVNEFVALTGQAQQCVQWPEALESS